MQGCEMRCEWMRVIGNIAMLGWAVRYREKQPRLAEHTHTLVKRAGV